MGATAGLGVLSWGGLGRAGDGGGSIAARLDAAVEQAIIEADFSGVLMLNRGGKVVYQRAVGQAEREFGAANRIDTRFNVASIGKMFTATAVLRLVEQRRIDLDAPILRYLPDYPVRTIAEQITVRQLLSTSLWSSRPANGWAIPTAAM